MKEEELNKIIETIDFKPLKHITGDIYLNDNQIQILDKYKINYKKCTNIKELIYEIEEIINDNYNYSDIDDLDWLSQNLSEFNYYNNTNK